MQHTIEFNLAEKLKQWENDLAKSPVVTSDDRDMLKDHLMDLVEKYVQLGNTDEEAFVLALHKLGNKSSWEDTFADVNSNILQLKRTVSLTGGIFLYFFFYYLLLVLDKSVLIVGANLHFSPENLTGFSRIFFQAICLITVFLMVTLVIQEKHFLKLLSRLQLTPKRAIIILISIISLAIIDRICLMFLNGLIKKSQLRMDVFSTFNWMNYVFPMIICIGFILIYLKYFRIAKSNL
ncbi:MAG: hypothetical protein JXR36_16555 [Bacteroidales bacterium]|nr:hypothetical protein [Bacteroidales bacterium]